MKKWFYLIIYEVSKCFSSNSINSKFDQNKDNSRANKQINMQDLKNIAINETICDEHIFQTEIKTIYNASILKNNEKIFSLIKMQNYKFYGFIFDYIDCNYFYVFCKLLHSFISKAILNNNYKVMIQSKSINSSTDVKHINLEEFMTRLQFFPEEIMENSNKKRNSRTKSIFSNDFTYFLTNLHDKRCRKNIYKTLIERDYALLIATNSVSLNKEIYILHEILSNIFNVYSNNFNIMMFALDPHVDGRLDVLELLDDIKIKIQKFVSINVLNFISCKITSIDSNLSFTCNEQNLIDSQKFREKIKTSVFSIDINSLVCLSEKQKFSLVNFDINKCSFIIGNNKCPNYDFKNQSCTFDEDVNVIYYTNKSSRHIYSIYRMKKFIKHRVIEIWYFLVYENGFLGKLYNKTIHSILKYEKNERSRYFLKSNKNNANLFNVFLNNLKNCLNSRLEILQSDPLHLYNCHNLQTNFTLQHSHKLFELIMNHDSLVYNISILVSRLQDANYTLKLLIFKPFNYFELESINFYNFEDPFSNTLSQLLYLSHTKWKNNFDNKDIYHFCDYTMILHVSKCNDDSRFYYLLLYKNLSIQKYIKIILDGKYHQNLVKFSCNIDIPNIENSIINNINNIFINKEKIFHDYLLIRNYDIDYILVLFPNYRKNFFILFTLRKLLDRLYQIDQHKKIVKSIYDHYHPLLWILNDENFIFFDKKSNSLRNILTADQFFELNINKLEINKNDIEILDQTINFFCSIYSTLRNQYDANKNERDQNYVLELLGSYSCLKNDAKNIHDMIIKQFYVN